MSEWGLVWRVCCWENWLRSEVGGADEIQNVVKTIDYVSLSAPILIHPWTVRWPDDLSNWASDWSPNSEPPCAFQHNFPNYIFFFKMKTAVHKPGTLREMVHQNFMESNCEKSILHDFIVHITCNWNLQYFADINYEKLMKISHISQTIQLSKLVFKNNFFLFQSLCSPTYTNKPGGPCGCLCFQIRVSGISNRLELTLPGWVSLSQILCWRLGVS